MQAHSSQEKHTFSSGHLPFITHPQCLRAGIAQATQLQSLHKKNSQENRHLPFITTHNALGLG